MKNVFSEAIKRIKEKEASSACERDDEGRAVIHMLVQDDDNFLSEYSESDTPVISGEVAEFIEHVAAASKPNERLTLRIKSNCIDEKEQVLYKTALEEYYRQKYAANEREYRRNKIIVAALTFAGVLALAFRIIFEYVFAGSIWSEVIDIFAWVLLWEAVDIGVFGNRTRKLDRLRYLSFIDMKIEYVEDDTKAAKKS